MNAIFRKYNDVGFPVFRLGKVWKGVRDREDMARIRGLRESLLDSGIRLRRQNI